ncbi:DUF1998 domain-containing protein [bacterium]|nr:DUF1998 domain-containing protein [bacterium]
MSFKFRRAQTIQPFGVGAVVDFQGESFLVQSIDRWTEPPKKVEMKRLERAVGGKRLLSFDEQGGGGRAADQAVSLYRFPRWYHCSRCGHLRFIDGQHDKRHSTDGNTKSNSPKCMHKSCKDHEMSPMRFVAYCNAGHLSEINWHSWCHRGGDEAGKGRCADKRHLYFNVSGRDGGDFHTMSVECRADGCGRKEDLSDVGKGIAHHWLLNDRPKGGGTCSGRQPWQFPESGSVCEEQMRIEPKGSSSIYRGRILSALDLEKHEDVGLTPQSYRSLDDLLEDLIMENPGQRQILRASLASSKNVNPYTQKIRWRASRLQITFEEAQSYLLSSVDSKLEPQEREAVEPEGDVDQKRIFSEEMEAFRKGQDRDSGSLIIEFTKPQRGLLGELFQRVGQVRSLRELRVLIGFTRGQGLKVQPASLQKNENDWLPCVEAYGEGIYFELSQQLLEEYLRHYDAEIRAFVTPQIESLRKLQEVRELDLPDSPLHILTHTLSHQLISRLTFNSGYSSSALRERCYVDAEENYAGILVYTTDTDSEGTLGGLVDQGRIETLEKIVSQIRSSASWCSADPVCRESVEQGFKGLNRSSCHCCSLISETSCQYSNAMLNRMLLGGLGKNNEPLGLLNFIQAV